MKKQFVVIIIVFMFPLVSSQFAQSNPIQLSLWNPLQIVDEAKSVSVLRLSIYGVNSGMTGLDLGIWNETRSQPQVGVQFGIVGKSLAGFTGWQASTVNISRSMFEGFQAGAVNYHTGKFSGLQLAIFNYTDSMNGIQIGLINIIKKGGFFPWFPIFNFSFD